jgi:predicted DNA-binding protein
MKYQNETITFRIPTETKKELQAVSSELRKHPSTLIRDIITSYLTEAKQQTFTHQNNHPALDWSASY